MNALQKTTEYMIIPKTILTTQDRKLVEALQASPLYQRYQEAFRTATGMSLFLRLGHTEQIPRVAERNEQSSFCGTLNQTANCEHCKHAHESLRAKVPGEEGASTAFCFAHMMESAVPVRCGQRTIAWLWTGQVFVEGHDHGSFDPIAALLTESGMSPSGVADLKRKWEATPEISTSRYQSIVTLLSAFGQQISQYATRLIMEHQPAEPESITKARKYVRDNLTEHISLEEAAQAAGLSTHHFCKVFRKIVGITFIDYVNRARVDLARDRLLNPHARISEIAFDCGYQSLSQFNRCFRAVTGENPTDYRHQRVMV